MQVPGDPPARMGYRDWHGCLWLALSGGIGADDDGVSDGLWPGRMVRVPGPRWEKAGENPVPAVSPA
jgi:hypothetical protein